jgi:hypothetical protein
MAGMDWFRWHHGSVTDPKFQLVAKRAGASVAEVLAVWACLLEAASMAANRGNPGDIDCEATDCALGLADGVTAKVIGEMDLRGLFREDGGITAWEKRQPKREREDDTNADRQRAFKARQNQVTPDNATDHQKTPREEKSREEKEIPSGGLLAGFAEFWAAWPTSDRKQARGKCHDAWKKAGAEPHAALVLAHVQRMKASQGWTKNGGEFIPAPLVYLNKRSWEGADLSANDADPYGLKGAI